MRKEPFRAWLATSHSDKATNNRVSRANRVERALTVLGLPHRDLDDAYEVDRLESVIDALRAQVARARNGEMPPAPLVKTSTKPDKQLLSLMNAVQNYRRFREHGAVPETGWPQLEAMKAAFLDRIPDFEDFEKRSGIYWEIERQYKEVILDRARAAAASAADDAQAGHAMYDALSPQEGPPLRWQTIDAIHKGDPALAARFDAALGRLGRSSQPVVAAIMEAAAEIEALRTQGVPSLGLGEVLAIVFGISAASRPQESAFFKIRKAQDLLGRLGEPRMFRGIVVERQEVEAWLGLLSRIRQVMRDEWGWKPRDLLDVQGFAWTVLDDRWSAFEDEDEPADAEANAPAGPVSMTQPTNLILYGPPGTGKTYATAGEAVKLCDGSAPADRDALMARYRELVEARRIDFVTFHQSYSYEEFVEGLRPQQGAPETESAAAGSSGFSLVPEDGLFRRIAHRAAASRGGGGQFAIGDRQVFKLSIGEAAKSEDDYLFEEALAEGHALLGYDDIDWSDARFERRDAVIAACREHDRANPENDRPEPTAHTGRVQCPLIFRNWIKRGDLVIVSKGNSRFRAIGEVTGEYEYAPRESGVYPHRRKVNWLWIDKAGAPVDDIYAKNFTMRAAYLLTRGDLNLRSLESYINSQAPGAGRAGPEPYVLIIDEINRGNISKIFGELITLIEPDKRAGMANAIEVRLPYSKEPFSVPANLHIVGTMNTADRSIALLDTALRRRFRFRELAPNPSLLPEAVDGVPLRRVLETINDRIEYLIDREHRIGHAFFLGGGGSDRAAVDATMRDKVIPLLQEYFFEDWGRVAAVLGEPQRKGGGFLDCRTLRDPTGQDGETRESWSVRGAFAADAYDRLIGKSAPRAAALEDSPDEAPE